MEWLQTGMGFLFGVMKCSGIRPVRVAQLCEYTKNYWNVHSKEGDFMVCELYLHRAFILKKCNHILIYYEPFPNIPNTYSSATFLFLIIQVMHIYCKKIKNAEELKSEREVFFPWLSSNTCRVPTWKLFLSPTLLFIEPYV